jgi:N-acetylmuramoyl-L-alanine amidase CwlA
MDIIKKTSTVHTGYLKNRSIQYIVLHYTAGTSSAKGVARNIAAMFANPNNRPASADFIVDDGEIVQYNPNIKDRYTYAVGGKPYSVRYTQLACTFYGKCKNHNSISIEMCSTKANKKSLQATDTDWSLSASVVDRAVELTKHLMKTYNIPADRVIMHHHVTGKLCPQPWCINPRRLDGWNKFKERLTDKKKEVEDLTKQETEKLIAEKLAVIEKKLDGIKPKAYNTEQEIPEWYKDAYLKVKPVLKGRAEGKLDLSEDLLRILTLMDRLGILPND